MSVDLTWEKLSPALATMLVGMLNAQLTTISRPSFIGPVEVTALDFGVVGPDVEIVDMRDIYRDFLEADEIDEIDERARQPNASDQVEEDEYEWVSRQEVKGAMAEEAPEYHHLPPHLRYGSNPSANLFQLSPGMYSPDRWSPGTNIPSLVEVQTPFLRRPALSSSMYMAPSPWASSSVSGFFTAPARSSASAAEDYDLRNVPKAPAPPASPSNAASAPSSPTHPNIQLHFRIFHQSDLRLTITTSLLINYPSPMFMSLPIKLSVIGLLFNGEVVVAYEGNRQRVHFSVLDDLDPYGPAGDRLRRESASATPTPGEDERPQSSKPLPAGQRLLPSIFIESEIGETDKHVLKNVTRVERFIQDVIRKTLEDELVFPNFHTVILGEQ